MNARLVYLRQWFAAQRELGSSGQQEALSGWADEEARADALEAEIVSKNRLLPSLLAEGKALEQQRAETAEAKVLVLEADCATMRRALEAQPLALGPTGEYAEAETIKARALATDSGKRLLEEHAAKVRQLETKLREADTLIIGMRKAMNAVDEEGR